MTDESSLQSRFGAAADRRTHEFQRLSRKEKDALADAVEAIRAEAEAQKERLRQEQAARREEDLAKERHKILTEKQQSTYRPWWAEGAHRLTAERVEQLAERAVEAAHAQQLSQVDAATEKTIDTRASDTLSAHAEFQQERDSTDLLRARWSDMQNATRYEGHRDAPAQGQSPPERTRGR